MTPDAPVSVIVCAYTEDRWAVLGDAVDAARKQLRAGDELILVVDHNEALRARCAQSFADAGVRVLANQRRRGLSGARNTGVAHARGAIVVFLDDDAIPLDGWLDALRAPYADAGVYGVGGVARPHWPGGTADRASGRGPGWFPAEFLWVVGCSHRGLPQAAQPVRNLLGATMSFRAAAFELAGEFREDLGRVPEQPLGGEETEFCIRLTRIRPGAVIRFDPAAQVEHVLTRPRARLGYFVRRCWAEGVSKAGVSRQAGPGAALSTEREYTTRVLPRAVARGLADGLRGDGWGPARAGAVLLGLSVTTAGYGTGVARGRFAGVMGGGET
jgi:GT2 family glycosyltransferase